MLSYSFLKSDVFSDERNEDVGTKYLHTWPCRPTDTHMSKGAVHFTHMPLLDHQVFCFQVNSLVLFWVPKSVS